MSKFNEATLANWTRPPSDAEETKLANAERMVREAIEQDKTLSAKSISIFGQGSYANDTNVRLNSDIDINVQYTGGFYFKLPPGIKREDFGLNSPSEYSLEKFKTDVEFALVRKFGRDSVKKEDKCITIFGNSYRVQTDVVPTWRHRWYDDVGGFVDGVILRTESGVDIINYPRQHIENGKSKNANTSKRYKRLTRIIRKLRYKMIEDGVYVSDAITSFLLECLVWNIPNDILNNNVTWQDRLRSSLVYLYDCTSENNNCENWGEVSELLYLFHNGRKWERESVNQFIFDMWSYLEYQ